MPVSEASNQPRSRPGLAALPLEDSHRLHQVSGQPVPDRALHKAQWHLQGSLAGPRGESYCHTRFTDEDSGAHAGLWPGPGHPLEWVSRDVTSALPDLPQWQESRCRPLCQAAPRSAPSDRTATWLAPSLLLRPDLVPATHGAPECLPPGPGVSARGGQDSKCVWVCPCRRACGPHRPLLERHTRLP